MSEVTDGAPASARNVVVVGSGRSGTSLVAGLIGTAGHHMGRRLVRANEANPRGFFEDYRTMLVNEQLLAPHTQQPAEPRYTGVERIHPRPLGEFERWLAVLWPDTRLQVPEELGPRMRATITESPWCRKDPRFCHTLPAWEPVFGDALRVCVFREPSRTANSMVQVAAKQKVELTFDGALEVWAAAYLQILRQHRSPGEWLFLHYDQLFDGTGVARLERALGAQLEAGFVEPALRRASPAGEWPEAVGEIYAQLCDAAGFSAPPA